MKAFSIEKPNNPLPLVFDSPHSGTHYPNDFNYACPFSMLEAAEDKYVEELFAHATKHGVTFLQAHFPRSYIDVNRAVDDIDIELLDGKWTGETPINATSRSHAGIGLIRRLVKPGIPVYNRSLSSEEVIARIEKYYTPYHDALHKTLKELHYNYGQVWHINCHSMPGSSAYPKRAIGLIGNTARPVDFCLGDRDGTTCDPAFTHALRDFIKNLGYTVSINDPFKGVECINKYSNPELRYNALQIEINKVLYMNEDTRVKNGNFERLQKDLEKITVFCADYVQSQLVNLAAD